MPFWNRFIDLNPENTVAYLKRAKKYKNLNKLELAKIDFNKACELGADNGCEEAKVL